MAKTKQKNVHAVALGRKGGRVGGRAKSTAKMVAARKNGLKGGRPKAKRLFTKALNSLARGMITNPKQTVREIATGMHLDEDDVAQALGFGSFEGIDKMFEQYKEYERTHPRPKM